MGVWIKNAGNTSTLPRFYYLMLTLLVIEFCLQDCRVL